MIITLTTDFGWADGYVGAMKGVILSIAPDVQVVDVAHEIPPGDVRAAAYVLRQATPYFPPGTIHVAVVDPGVGSDRRALAARTPQAIWIAPDNGLLSLCLAEGPVEIRQLSNPRYHRPQVSATFHGRDVFAPVAAHLARGAPFDELGPLVTAPVQLAWPRPVSNPDGSWRGQVVHIDRFGNLVTNFDRQMMTLALRDVPPAQVMVEIAGQRITGLKRTYADGAPGELMLLVGSSEQLEIAIRDGDAARTLHVRPGDGIILKSVVR